MSDGEPPQIVAQSAEQPIQIHLFGCEQFGDRKAGEGDGHARNEVLEGNICE